MKKLIYSILFIGVLSTSIIAIMAMQNGEQVRRVRRGDKITLGDGRRVEFVSIDRPENTRGLELIYGAGWVKVINWGRHGNLSGSSSITDNLTDTVLSNFMAFSAAWIVGWIKKEAVEEQLEGYVELESIVIDLLSNGVWENINELPGTLLSLGLAGSSWSRQEKELLKSATNLFTSKFTEKYEEESIDNIEDFVANLKLDGLYIDPKRVSDILHESAKAWDGAAGLQGRGTTGTSRTNGQQRRSNGQRTYRGQSNVQVTTAEQGQIRNILGSRISVQIQRNIKQGYLNGKLNKSFTGNFVQYLIYILDGAKMVGMQNDISGYIGMTYS